MSVEKRQVKKIPLSEVPFSISTDKNTWSLECKIFYNEFLKDNNPTDILRYSISKTSSGYRIYHTEEELRKYMETRLIKELDTYIEKDPTVTGIWVSTNFITYFTLHNNFVVKRITDLFGFKPLNFEFVDKALNSKCGYVYYTIGDQLFRVNDHDPIYLLCVLASHMTLEQGIPLHVSKYIPTQKVTESGFVLEVVRLADLLNVDINKSRVDTLKRIYRKLDTISAIPFIPVIYNSSQLEPDSLGKLVNTLREKFSSVLESSNTLSQNYLYLPKVLRIATMHKTIANPAEYISVILTSGKGIKLADGVILKSQEILDILLFGSNKIEFLLDEDSFGEDERLKISKSVEGSYNQYFDVSVRFANLEEEYEA